MNGKSTHPPNNGCRNHGTFWLSRGFFARFLTASLICPRIVRVRNMLSVHKYSKNFSSLYAPAYLANFSERIRERKLLHSSFSYSGPPRGEMLAARLSAIHQRAEFSEIQDVFYSSVKPSKHVKNSIWLVDNTEFSLRHKTRVHCSLRKTFPWSSTTRPKFLKSNLVSHLFHGYKDPAGQSSWWSILFCVHVYIHWSKAVALFAQFLSSLPERNSTNERRPW